MGLLNEAGKREVSPVQIDEFNEVRTLPQPHPPHLGLVCVTLSDEIRFRTITRTRYLKLSPAEQRQTLQNLYEDNLNRLRMALIYCEQHGIQLYRLSSSLFPMSDEEPGSSVLEGMKNELAAIGQEASRLNIRLVIHPDQFVVLSSDNPKVVETSVSILQKHARMLDWMGLPRSAWTTMMIHGGKSDRAERLVQTIRGLPEPVKSRLALENDEYSYSARQILDICQQSGVPMVFDLHHYVVYEGLDNYEDPGVARMLAEAAKTWPNPAWQLVHISNGKDSFGDRKHSDFITTVPGSLRNAPWIEVEAKHKEQAIARLRELWPVAD